VKDNHRDPITHEDRHGALEPTADGWIGFDSRSGRLLAEVMPAGYMMIASRPRVPFRGARLFVHLPIASSFLIHSLRVGVREMTVVSAPIPADAFATRMDALAEIDAMFARDKVIEIKVGKSAAELLGSPWTLPIARDGIEIAICVENIGAAPLRFLAGMCGKVFAS